MVVALLVTVAVEVAVGAAMKVVASTVVVGTALAVMDEVAELMAEGWKVAAKVALAEGPTVAMRVLVNMVELEAVSRVGGARGGWRCI